jgi:hypothetical protein
MQRVQQEVMMDQGFGATMASVDVRGAAQQPARQQLAGPVPMELGVMRAQPGQGGQAKGKCYETVWGSRPHQGQLPQPHAPQAWQLVLQVWRERALRP